MSFSYLKAHLTGMLNHFIDALFFGLIPVCLFGLLIGFFLTIKIKRCNHLDILIVYAFAFIGSASGIMIGSSRSGVVHVFLPAMLTFVSTFMVYLYVSKNVSEGERKDLQEVKGHGNIEFIPYCITALVVSSVTLSFYGSSLRDAYDKEQRAYNEYLMEFEKIQIPLNYEVLKKQINDDSEN